MSGGNFTQKYGIVATERLFWAIGKHPLLIKAVFPKEKALKDLSFDVREDFEKLVKKIRVELRKPEITSEECYKAVKTLKASYNTKKCSQVWIGKFPFLEKTKSSPSSDAEKTEAPASEGEPKEFLPKSEEQKSTEARKMVITQEHPRTSEFSAITPEMVRYAEEKLVEWQLRHPCTSKGSRAPQDEAMTVLESMTSRDLKLKKEVAKAEMRALKPERKRTTGVDEIAFVKNRNLTDPVRFLKLEGLDEASERSQVKRVKLPQGIPKNPRPSRWDQKQPVPKEPKDPLLLINQESDRQKDVKKLLEQEVELFTPPTTPGHYDVNAPDFSDPFTLYGDSISQDFSDSSAGSWLDNVPFEFCAPVEKSTKPLKEVKTCSVMPKTEGPEVRPKTPTNELLYHPETHDPKDIYGTPTKEVLSEIWKVYTEYNAKNIIRR
ncbi:hypothetical protein L596_019638 [Steinernema carpocapsae]|uniref:Uncharacterized protein n=1 Tax=Steinernema carpocapsae TaxID=34508 RepID=A0A4U5MRY5_STECR|nr:hypothetical protein L596_019638 [Steinernema carpocapsae]